MTTWAGVHAGDIVRGAEPTGPDPFGMPDA
jgi:hypothetical protein